MTYAFMTEPVNGVSIAMLRREGRNKVIVQTVETLSDEQVKDLYWIVLAMVKTGKTLTDILKESKNEVDRVQRPDAKTGNIHESDSNKH